MSHRNFTGKRYGFLTVTGFSHVSQCNRHYSLICDCGNHVTRRIKELSQVKYPERSSCGCKRITKLPGYKRPNSTTISYRRCPKPKPPKLTKNQRWNHELIKFLRDV